MPRDHVSWGQKLVKAPRRFKGVQDGVYRVMIIDEKAEHGYIHYLGEYIKCLGQGCPACKQEIRRSERYGFNMVVYDLDQNLKPKEPVSYKIIPWICSYKVFNLLQESFEMNGPFHNYDFKLICDGAKFQSFQVVAYRDAALWNLVPGLKDQVMRDYQTKAADVDKTMGRTVSQVEMVDLVQKNPQKEDGDQPSYGARRSAGSSDSGGSGQSIPSAAKTEESLFGKGSRQVQSLVGAAVDSALASVSLPPPPTYAGSVTIAGNTAPPGAVGSFPPPMSAEIAATGHIAVVDPPLPAPNLPGAAPSAGFADLISKLKDLDKKK